MEHMEPIHDKFIFSRPQLLHTGIHSQVVRFNFRLAHSRKVSGDATLCVLKFYAPAARIPYQKELAVYRCLLASSVQIAYPKPFGYAEWSREKYVSTIGEAVQEVVGRDGNAVFVLMLEYIDQSTPLSSLNMSPNIKKAAIWSLCLLHSLRIIHGDISTSNALLLEEHEPARVVWIDFSSASTEASEKDLALEKEKVIEYFRDSNGTDKEELIRITSLFQPAKTRRGRESIEALPRVEKSLTFYDWMLIAKGTHAHIYRTKQVGLEDSPPYLCVKLFRKGWMTPFNLEKTAYEYLDAAHLERYIPFVFGYDSRTLSQWGLPNVDANDNDLYYAIVMEWIEDAEELSAENITLDSATMILTGLHKIHGAGVLHWDTYKRNMLVVPSENKGLWTDFSCALMGHEAGHSQEMESVQWVVLETLLESGRRRGAREITNAFASYTPLSRRVLGLTFSFSLAVEGVFSIMVCASGHHGNPTSAPIWLHSAVRNGLVYVFAAALLTMVSSAIHLHTPLFKIALVIKFLYLLFNASTSISLLPAPATTGLLRVWVVIRAVTALLLLGNDFGELFRSKHQKLSEVPGWEERESSSSEASSSHSGNSSDASY